MIEFELDDIESQRNFWIVALGFIYLSAGALFLLDEFMLGIVNLGMAITLTAVAREKLNDAE